MFEFYTAINEIPLNQLYLYYFLLLSVYLIFLRGVRHTILSAVILLLFNQGFFESLIADSGLQITKVFFILFVFILLLHSRYTTLHRREWNLLFTFVLFTLIFFAGYLFNGMNVLWALFQYYKYVLPVALYFGIKGQNLTCDDYQYYGKLIINMLWFQIAFSVIKIVVLGLRENITGSIANLGGGIGVGYAIMGAILYWVLHDKRLKGKEWLFLIFLLIIPAASNKRAIWLIYPIVISMLTFHKVTKQTTRNTFLIVILLPMIIYIGLRLNPSMNPERELWGSFDPQYALSFVFSYSGVSEEKLSDKYAQGRWGAASAVIREVGKKPFERDSMIGFPRSRSGGVTDDFKPEEYGLLPGTMISSIGTLIIQMGWPATILLISVFLRLIFTIPDKRTAGIISIYVLWDTIFYSGSMIGAPVQSLLLVIAVCLIKHNYHGESPIHNGKSTRNFNLISTITS